PEVLPPGRLRARRSSGGIAPAHAPSLGYSRRCRASLSEPAKQLTGDCLRRKIRIQLTVHRTGEYAGQVLGGARIYADSPSRELALRRQYLVRRSAPRGQPLYFRLRHWLPHAWSAVGERCPRAADPGTHLCFSFPLGPHSGHPFLPSPV